MFIILFTRRRVPLEKSGFWQDTRFLCRPLIWIRGRKIDAAQMRRVRFWRQMNNLCNELRHPSAAAQRHFWWIASEINTHSQQQQSGSSALAAVAACKLQFRCREWTKKAVPRGARAATFYSIFYCSIIKKRDFAAYLITLRASEREPEGKSSTQQLLFFSFPIQEQEKLNFAAAARAAAVSFLGRITA